MKLLRSSLLCLLLCSSLAAYNLSEVAKDYIAKAEQCKADNNIEKALEYYKNAIALNPEDFMLIFNTANDLYNHSHHEEAVKYYDRAIALRPDVEQVYFNKGVVLTQLNRHEEAADCFMQAINTNRNYAKAYVHAGHALEKCAKHEQAITTYKRGMEIDEGNADLNYRLGLVYKHKDRFEEAIDELRKATEKNEQSQVYKLELANTLHLINGSEEALRLYEQILERNPRNYHVMYNFGYTLKKMGYIEKAIEVYDKVLEMDPNYALARFSRSLSYLTLGDWKHGWKEYEWRWTAYNESPKKFDRASVWDGSDLYGKRILLYAEQGLGDTIQFIRYAELIKNMGAYIIVETQGPLKDLLKLCPYIDEVYARGESIPPFDTQIALMSLPMIFKTEIDSTPHNIPYIYALPELVSYWAEQLKDDHNFKIGICWQGNPNYRTQFLRQAVAGKSMHVKQFEPIAQLEGVSIYNLQKMGGEEQLSELAADIQITSFGSDFDNSRGRFMDTVAIMKNLDLIITIDTGTCHVAAALGVPTWNLLPNPADWRWMVDRTDTPWYNNMRLFKQPKSGDWEGSIKACVKALQPILRGEKTVEQVTQEKGIIKERRPYENTGPLDTQMTQMTPQSTAQQPRIKDASHSSCIRTLDTGLFPFESLEKDGPVQNKKLGKSSAYEQAMNKIAQEHPEVQQIMEERNRPTDMNDLTSNLIAINKQLWEYDQKLKEQNVSVFDDEFMQLAQQITNLYQQKCYVKAKIKQTARERHISA